MSKNSTVVAVNPRYTDAGAAINELKHTYDMKRISIVGKDSAGSWAGVLPGAQLTSD
jgi:hypothetical protein